MKIRGMTLAALVCLAQPAFAAYTLYVYENGGNVVAEGSGSFNTSALNFLGGPSNAASYIYNNTRDFCLGAGTFSNQVPVISYGFASPLASFGPTADQQIPDSSSGSQVCVYGSATVFAVPSGYQSGAPLGTSTAVWQGATLSSLKLTPGTYQSTWGEGDAADSFTLVIRAPAPPAVPAVTAVPTLNEWGLILLAAMAGALGLRARRKA